MVYRSPQIKLLALDGDDYLVQVRLVTRFGTTATNLVGIGLAKLLAPTPNRLIGNKDVMIEHHLLNVAVAQRKGKIQPNPVLDNLDRETVAMVSAGYHLRVSHD